MKLVLLPGMDGTGRLFGPLVKALGPGFNAKVVRYPSVEPLGYSELTAFARAELPEGPVILLGESFSGPVAISIAAACPSQVRGLILCCSFARNPRPLFSGLGSVVGVLPVASPPTVVLSYLLLGRFATPEQRAALSNAVAQVSPSAFRERLKAVLSVNVSKEFSGLNIPVLYLQAALDRVVPPSAGEHVSSLNPRTRMVRLEAPHFLLQAAPTEAAGVISSFVTEVKSAL